MTLDSIISLLGNKMNVALMDGDLAVFKGQTCELTAINKEEFVNSHSVSHLSAHIENNEPIIVLDIYKERR